MEHMRWGIMGTGGIAAAMAGTLRAAGLPIAAVGSPRPGAAEAFAAEWDISGIEATHQAVAHRDDVDVVYVATTNDRHYQNVLDCVAAGVPALCEKPIAVNLRQGREMLGAARGAGVFVMEAMWMRFQPFMAKLDELIGDGRIGELRHIAAGLSFSLSLDPDRRWANRAMGGGALLDLGVYPLTLVHHLAGPAERFEAIAQLGPTGVDLSTDVISQHPDGVVASLSSSFLADGPNEAVISGTEGRIRLHDRFHQTQKLTVEHGDDRIETLDVSYDGHGFQFEVAEVERCVSEGLTESPLRPHADTLAVSAWMDAIRERTGVVFPQDE